MSDQRSQPAINWPEDPADAKPPASTGKPMPVKIAVILMWVGTALAVFQAGIMAFWAYLVDDAQRMAEVRRAIEAQGRKVSDETIDAMLQALSPMFMVFAVIALLWVAMAILNHQGRGWARITATFLGVANIGWTLLNGLGPLTLLSLVTGLAVVVLLWVPSTRAWFDAVKSSRYGAAGATSA